MDDVVENDIIILLIAIFFLLDQIGAIKDDERWGIFSCRRYLLWQ